MHPNKPILNIFSMLYFYVHLNFSVCLENLTQFFSLRKRAA